LGKGADQNGEVQQALHDRRQHGSPRRHLFKASAPRASLSGQQRRTREAEGASREIEEEFLRSAHLRALLKDLSEVGYAAEAQAGFAAAHQSDV